MTTKEKPVRVIPHKGEGHKTETRVFARNIHETYCMQPGCRFRGKNAQQGVCFSREPFVTGADWKHYELLERHATEALEEERRLYRGKGTVKYIQHLEAALWCAHLNTASTLDELIYLRKQVGILGSKLERAKRKR